MIFTDYFIEILLKLFFTVYVLMILGGAGMSLYSDYLEATHR